MNPKHVVSLYDIVKRYLPGERETCVRKMYDCGKCHECLQDITFNTCLYRIKEKLSKVEINEDEINEIIQGKKTICNRCEGNGRLWADGKAHFPSYSGETILCGDCSGNGFIINEEIDLAQAILTYLTELKED